ncbi:hypothetical protein [Candidatus Nitrotoga sp. AM1P]|uniref:hypothetical protein n=1 Tax=Candidatus Nitrotoga sp. AM1P TaxID=2559597 RepID=UPI0010BA12DD|nr:hypothetical protein [Candidatus Nitrotoga sp. AM1P]BBJ22612.1 hypothetical protein W01_05390 [Candidatus Nitrotoga sp. AM1P]
MNQTDSNVLPDLASPAKAVRDAKRRALPAGEAKFKRLPRQSMCMPPEGAKSSMPGFSLGFGRSFVPVSSVARDWGISPRRVRMMLTEGRLDGRQLENGYWEVSYPYNYIFGTRGPAIKRQRDLPEKPKKQEWKPEW